MSSQSVKLYKQLAKSKIVKNTINFAEGNFTNNALLWGARGNGKSSLIKSVFHKVLEMYKNIKLIQIKIKLYLENYYRQNFLII